MITFIQFSPNNSKQQLKEIFEIKFVYVTNNTAQTSIKNHIYHYSTPHQKVIFDSHGVTGNHILH
jgi:hypothetical protein